MKTASDHEVAKQLLDVLSVATVIGAIVDILPSIAALFTIVWNGSIVTGKQIGRAHV